MRDTPCAARGAEPLAFCAWRWGLPTLNASNTGHGNGATVQSMENDEAVSHPSHSHLEDADKARISHIPTTTTTRLVMKRQAAATASLEAQRGNNPM